MITIIRALLHLSPLLPLFMGHWSLAAALFLFVILSYIKVFKLKQQLLDLSSHGGDSIKEASIQKILDRWISLTYLAKK